MHLPSCCALALLATAVPAAAQVAPPPGSSPEVIVEAERAKPSNWRRAETDHVIVYSDGPEAELTRVAQDLERLHFLLSALMGRIGKVDDTIKLQVTLIGANASFADLDLDNRRWQQGPFSARFTVPRYYDPRQDGAVVASTRQQQQWVLERGPTVQMALLGLDLPNIDRTDLNAAVLDLQSSGMVSNANEKSVILSPENTLFSAYAQHFLLTYFPAAYPRWYLDGFGEIFSTLTFRGEGVMEFGRAPAGTAAVLERFGGYPLRDVLDGAYLDAKPSRTHWTPIHAWLLTHFLFFSDARRPQLRQYLLARARGESPEAAANAFGDLDAFSRELKHYFGARKPYDRMTYPKAQAEAPIVRRLSVGEAAVVEERLQLGPRLELPAASAAGADADTAEAMTADRTKAIAAQQRWLADLRRDAARVPTEFDTQLVLAEAECRALDPSRCGEAADRALALAPADPRALTWKGVALARAALAGPSADRDAGLRAARATLGRANHADTEGVMPLIEYYRSFADAGEPVPDVAIAGLLKAVDSVPAAPASRLMLGTALAAHGNAGAARSALLPVVDGPYASPERPAAAALLATLPAQ